MITKQNVKSAAFVARLVSNTRPGAVGLAFSTYEPEVQCNYEKLVEAAKAVGKEIVFEEEFVVDSKVYQQFGFVYEGVRFFALKDKEEDKKQ